jgi:hypothetical protein
MSTYSTPASRAGLADPTVRSETTSPTRQAYRILHLGFIALPILAGLDKFFHVLTDWDKYLAPVISSMLGGRGHEFMLAVGVIEIVAGIGVALKPRLFAWVVAGWLGGIIVNLLLVGGYLDVALRDFGLMLAAIALARLSADPATG